MTIELEKIVAKDTSRQIAFPFSKDVNSRGAKNCLGDYAQFGAIELDFRLIYDALQEICKVALDGLNLIGTAKRTIVIDSGSQKIVSAYLLDELHDQLSIAA